MSRPASVPGAASTTRAPLRAVPVGLVVAAYFAYTELHLGFSDLEQVSVESESFWTYPASQARVPSSARRTSMIPELVG